MLLAIPANPRLPSMWSSVKFQRPQENKLLPFPSRTVLASEEELIFWEVTPCAERKEPRKTQSWSQTKQSTGRRRCFPHCQSRECQEGRRSSWPHVLPGWPRLTPKPWCLPGLSLLGCCSPGGRAAGRQIWTHTSWPTLSSGLVCFVSWLPTGTFSSSLGTVEAPARWHRSRFSLALSLSELLLHCSRPFSFCGISISLQ